MWAQKDKTGKSPIDEQKIIKTAQASKATLKSCGLCLQKKNYIYISRIRMFP